MLLQGPFVDSLLLSSRIDPIPENTKERATFLAMHSQLITTKQSMSGDDIPLKQRVYNHTKDIDKIYSKFHTSSHRHNTSCFFPQSPAYSTWLLPMKTLPQEQKAKYLSNPWKQCTNDHTSHCRIYLPQNDSIAERLVVLHFHLNRLVLGNVLPSVSSRDLTIFSYFFLTIRTFP